MPAEPFLAQVCPFGFNFAPKGWAFCNGQLMPISQNTAVFSLLGTTFGGNGQVTFGLPNLQGRTPMHFSGALPLGAAGGQTAVTLQLTELPSHTHPLRASSAEPTTNRPAGAAPALGGAYGAADGATLDPQSVGTTGEGLAHENMPPYATLSFCIALTGIFPPREL